MSETLLLCSLLMVSGPGHADEEFTPLGAIKAGNATGEIPAFEGEAKDTQCPRTYTKGDYLLNPYKDEKPLFRLDHTNVDQHRDRLSPGQIARLMRNENFFMNVYPSHRTMVFSKESDFTVDALRTGGR